MNDTVRRVVVGVDGSAGSKTALTWAMTEARLSGSAVEAITTWQDPILNAFSYGYAPAVYDDPDFPAALAKLLDDTIAEVSGQLEHPVAVLSRVVEGHPAQVLLDAAADAQLLVVGSRGHGTFAGIMLGSVSQHCVQHAPCPVVVVPQ